MATLEDFTAAAAAVVASQGGMMPKMTNPAAMLANFHSHQQQPASATSRSMASPEQQHVKRPMNGKLYSITN